jgi:serine/threonine protein kinase/Tfp pilus assembly protein PilF
MSSSQLQKIEAIFHSVLDCTPDKRSAFLDSACAGDDFLRRQVEALLTSDHESSKFIETPPAALVESMIESEGAETASLLGRTIGHYKIVKLLGRGGMGEAYLATDTRAERKAVLKVLPARFTADPDRTRRFQHEARTVIALNHPNIVTIYEVGEEDSTYYIVSELIQGQTLRQRLSRGSLDLEETIDITVQVATGLSAAHEAGVVHRDIKPENVMLRRDGYVKILDFGIAKLAEPDTPLPLDPEAATGSVATNVGAILGTVRYMSPEQARGEQVDHRTDIWSLGVVLYELVARHPPFAGETAQETTQAILTLNPPPIDHKSRVGRDLQAVVNNALQKDRDKRYSTIAAMADALKNLQRKLEVAAELKRAPLWFRWLRTPAALLLALLVVALAVSLPSFWSRSRSPGTESKAGIAVLPFQSLSEEKSNAYFADGIQDEILARLSKISDLKVISRTSTQKYKSTPTNLRDIARQLGVANILEGSVQKAADQVRITVQLINATTDAHLWVETYDRKLLDSFQVESDIAEKISSTLEAKLTGKEKAAINARGTDNAQAYETYLRALALNNSQSDADNAQMRDLLREAVGLDPNFAEAWAWLAVIESNRYFFPKESSAQKERARNAAETALRLAPDSADAIGSMGLYYYYVEKNYDEALRWLDRARAIAPNVWKCISATALVKRRQGKVDEAIALQERGAELDPLNVSIWMDLAWSYRGRRDFEHERAILDRALTISPNDANIVAQKAESYAAGGDLEKSWQMVRDLKFEPSDNGAGIALDIVIARRDYDEAIRRITAMRESGKEPPLFQALDRAVVGQLKFAQGDSVAAEPLLKQAEGELTRLRDRHEGGIIVLDQLIFVEACLGRPEEVERIGEQLRATRFDKWTYPFNDVKIATAYALMGDADRAVPLLETALHETYAWAATPAYLRFDPRFDRIRNDPRFQKLANSAP